MRINRPDLAEATLRILKSTDEDNCLTVLAQTWLHVSSVKLCGNQSIATCHLLFAILFVLDSKEWNAIESGWNNKPVELVEWASRRIHAEDLQLAGVHLNAQERHRQGH